MHEIFLIRYAEYENGHITAQGIKTMQRLAFKLKPSLEGSTFQIVAAEVDRAMESAEILAQELPTPLPLEVTPLLYAAEEDGREPDIQAAATFLSSLSEKNSVFVILSREYIEALPHYFLSEAPEKVSLQRGEAVKINKQRHILEFIR